MTMTPSRLLSLPIAHLSRRWKRAARLEADPRSVCDGPAEALATLAGARFAPVDVPQPMLGRSSVLAACASAGGLMLNTGAACEQGAAANAGDGAEPGPLPPLAARLVALADFFDALTSMRPYKAAWPFEQALAAIVAEAGRHFDPAVVATQHRRLPEVLAFDEQREHV